MPPLPFQFARMDVESLTAEDVRRWLADAEQLEMTDPTVQRGINRA